MDRDQIWVKYAKMAQRATAGSFTSAIRLFCLECMGGSSCEVRVCTDLKCPLWAYRMGRFGGSRDEVCDDA